MVNMKKYLALLFVLFSAQCIEAKRQVYAHSFMYTKPGYYDIVMEQALWHDIAYNKKGNLAGGLQIIPFFQHSIPLAKNARYFLIEGKTELLVSGDANIEDLKIRDIRAEWVNLPSNFRGFLSVNPKQKQNGCTLEYHQDFKNWVDLPFIRDMYISVMMPITSVHNDINLAQCYVTNPGTEFPRDILEAFNQPDWCYSRIENGGHKSGVSEITVRLGTSYISEDHFQLNYYSAMAIPTGNKQNAQTMFEPVNGNNHHFGIGAGINIQAPLNRDTTTDAFCFFLDLESIILIRNKQFRTYDLFDKPWSRFMQMNGIACSNLVEAQPEANQPGVNFMTQRITAKPFNIVDFAAGWRLRGPHFEGEVGYGIWGHGTERTDLNQPFNEVFGIAGSAPGKTASKSTISCKAPDDEEFVPITKFDFNRQSGESFGGFNQRAYLSLGVINKGIKSDQAFGAGASVDVPFHNSLLQLWKVWLKLSATF